MVKQIRSNRIRGLEDDNEVWWDDLAKVEDMARECFVNLFTTSNPRRVQEVMEWVDPRVSMGDNEELIMPILDEEVRSAAFQIPAFKSPGSDKFSSGFFQDHWEVVGVRLF
ncbi:hypothetical protein TB2_031466 [Malus domestica]